MFNLSKLASLKQAGTQGSFDNLSPDKAFHFRDPIHVNTDVDPCKYSARCRKTPYQDSAAPCETFSDLLSNTLTRQS